VFASWVHAIGASGQSAFSVLAEAGDKGLAHRELRNVIPRDTPVTRVLTILGYHGIVVEEADQRFHANGAIFRDWYTQNIGYVNDVPAPHAAPSPRATSDELRTRVFVVFGRDRKLYGAMIRFLRCLNLEPIEWNAALEATNNGAATVKDILEQALMMAQAVVVLLTPDDEARLRQPFHGPQEPPHETMLTPQPRPNVIFEAGFALAKFPTRTILVRFDKSTRLFSDIGGVFLLDLANDVNSRNDFIRRLKTVGLNVDDTGTDWQTKTAGGDFTPAI
jgi:predicted nucleotide-binding protein